MLFQATLLTYRIINLERTRSAMVTHMRPEAVVALLCLADGGAERGSIASFDVYDRRKEYFANKDGKIKIEAILARRGCASDAADIEAFRQALAAVTMIDRQINAAQKQMIAFLKEIGRRDAKRAEELRKAAVVAVLRAHPEAAGKLEAS